MSPPDPIAPVDAWIAELSPSIEGAAARIVATARTALGRTVRILPRGLPWEVTPGGLSKPARLELEACPRCGGRVILDTWAGEEFLRDPGTGSGRRAHGCAAGERSSGRGGVGCHS